MSALSDGRHLNNVDLALLCNHSVGVFHVRRPFVCSFLASLLPSFLRFSLPSFKFFFQGSGEQSQELYTFHEAVSQLQDAEDKLMDDDRNNIEVSLVN